MNERLHMATEIVPMYEVGSFKFARQFDPQLLARIAGDYQALTAFEEEFERQARRAAAERSLTVLRAEPPRWRDFPHGQRVLEVTYDVRHEPQANDKLIYEVYVRLARDPALWAHGTPNPQTIAAAAVYAIRDLGRLTAAVPRPDGIPE
jgi:hypothetical protein